MKFLPLTLALLAGAAHAQEEASPLPAACDGNEYREFGFWVGDWNVTQGGQPAGTNRIEWIDRGCAISESWTNAAGTFSGHSLNFYDRTTQAWHQVWVDSGGSVLRLKGGLERGPEIGEGAWVNVMVLRGEALDANGQTVHHRITWTPLPTDEVRQHWESSTDGATWTTSFDGLYTRKAKAPSTDQDDDE